MKLFRGKMLEGSRIMNFKMPTLYQCTTLGLSIQPCMSINFYRGQNTCDINEKSDEGQLKTDSSGSFTYIERKDMPKDLNNGDCETDTCDEKEICIDNDDDTSSCLASEY
ncbi:Hypothetical predicted protein [Mytilus galloprovincialis]|uniref:Apple domain-containing protein n=1 Tax=Mytilus galloprovincialis TaxID=29158 RepID=A0A8B6GFI7_MYTGA|nr:Hypothetical predicted protein [Mytilus galloprovincialis]